MPRFPGINLRRKSAAAEDPNLAAAEPSFRVLERPESIAGKSFEHAPRMSNGKIPNASVAELSMEDNIFAGLKNNRGGSNTTKTTSDNSSRHSNASTAPSSTDNGLPGDEGRASSRKPAPVTLSDGQTPPRNPGGFLKNASRTFSFGSSKKSSLPPIPAEEPVPRIPSEYAGSPSTPVGRARAETGSTITTTTPPQVEDRDFMRDLGGDLSSMLNFDKRSSILSLKDRNLLGGRAKQPSPLHLDRGSAVEPPPKSWNSQTSNDGLLGSGRVTSPGGIDSMPPPPVPRHTVGKAAQRAEAEDTFMEDRLAASKFLSSASSRPRTQPAEVYKPEFEVNDENMFATSSGRHNKPLGRLGPRSFTQPQTSTQSKVMTPEQFEKYRQDKVRQERMGVADAEESDKEDEDNYDDDDDEAERSAQAAKQRRKQEAHMTVYRQQMMKVTGDNAASGPRPGFQMSMSTPNLSLGLTPGAPAANTSPSDASEEDEEVPLAILAAHGFPNRNRPPTRLTTVGSNPNLRASVAPSYTVGGGGPGSVVGESGPKGPLPPFARKLPQDPYLGAGLINQPPRESFALGGGAPLREQQQQRALPVGGLVGVIANEERSRAMRRGSPAMDHNKNMMPNAMGFGGGMGGSMTGGFDPMAGMPPNMMYPMGMPPMLTPGDQAQIQMTQQMQQFMQMQMQFMQMQMSSQNPNQTQPFGNAPQRPISHLPRQSFSGSTMDMQRQSFLDPVRGDAQMRTMSMVQPSSASWIQPPQPGYAPSIRVQGGYTPSIAPSERSNVGLPGRYRPVSSMPVVDPMGRTSTMSGALSSLPQQPMRDNTRSPLANKGNDDEDDDDEQGWEAMKQKREKKKGLWRTKKSFGAEISAMIK
ncbi:hypothetical protein Micbo1qcDRAFT_29959 [Microdochium bolleyi]|uniref:Uncharacterized protein n=1 Tax=Microdochium bolleyi TaxID=196109 RepID=A0A136JFJ3_9PEZI|nr:hypothetical protein Micbo1qcDRAFT_29959 [Microdochium bolleyi]